MRKILLLVEGQTEETFVKTVLNPHLETFDRYAVPKIIATKIVKRGNQFKGGVPSYDNVRRQISRLLGDTSAVAIGTLIDYYALPPSFPGKNTIQGTTAVDRVEYLENQLKTDISERRFIPYYSLHEFEALLFSSPQEIANTLTAPQKAADLQAIRLMFSSPEQINDNPLTCPSARIRTLFPEYQKPLHGSLVTQRIGLQRIRTECSHFSQWLGLLERV